ncbi:MAG: Crp/Fnr family transcriptional regulator [Xanthobacteraceae bacterium]|jgi:CRP/FNR family cyclic AMP-dependent transcriptional regulator
MQRSTTRPSFDVLAFLAKHQPQLAPSYYQEKQTVYSQGDPADSVFYIHEGKVKVSVISKLGKEAIVAIRGPDEFCGEGTLTGLPLHLATVAAMTPCKIVRVEKKTMERLLHQESKFSDYFLAHLLTRTIRVEADLVDQLFNSSEMRLARALLLLANFGTDVGSEPIAIRINQTTLAALIGTTRGRVSTFMNKFRKLGLINYNGKVEVHRALLNYVLSERPPGNVEGAEDSC